MRPSSGAASRVGRRRSARKEVPPQSPSLGTRRRSKEETATATPRAALRALRSPLRWRRRTTREGSAASVVPASESDIDRAVHALAALGAAKSIAGSDMETWTLIRRRKLILILDLDHTLLDSTGTGLDDLSPAEQAKDTSGDLLRLDSDNNLGMLVKLRPFVRGFLEQAGSMFMMHGYTLRNQVYAKAAMDLLDPNGVYFGGRVVSIAKSAVGDTKSLGVFPGADPAAVVILHDTYASWASGHMDNLILTDRYRYFSSTCRKFGEDEIDGHRTDVRKVIREVRCLVLSGCTVAFSYLDESLERSPEFTLMWRLALRLGAVCKKDIDETVTHVVAEDPETPKAKWARDKGKFLVNLEWIKEAGFQLCAGWTSKGSR